MILDIPATPTAADRPHAAGQPSATPSATLLIMATESGTVVGFLAPFARHFRGLGWRVDGASFGASADRRLDGVFDSLHDLPLSRSLLDLGNLARGERAIERLLLDVRPDIVHVHTPIAGFLARLAARRMPAATRPLVVYTAHGFHFHRGGSLSTNAAFLTAERIAGRWTDRLIVINDEDEHAALRHRIVPRNRLVHMPGIGIDTRLYAPSGNPAAAERARAQLGVDGDGPLFVVIAELRARKRVGDAIAALAAMRHPSAELVIAGVGPDGPALETLASDLGLEKRVHFAGFIQDVRPVIESGTALVLPSSREGLARSVMEALALGVPVVASAARGNRDLVGDDGMVVEIGDVQALADGMDWLIDHPDERTEMGRRGRARMVERYDLSIVIRMHEELYAGLLARRAAGRG